MRRISPKSVDDTANGMAGARDRVERRITKLGSDLIAALSNKVTLPPDSRGDIDLWNVKGTVRTA